MNANEPAIKITAAFDRSRIWRGGDSVRYLQVGIATGPAPARDLPPLNLAVVIDASGSMSGPPLEAAKQATIALIERLSPRDVISAVSFASDVMVHADAVRLSNREGRRKALAAVAALETRGSTNLSGGWLAGAECAARVQASGIPCRSHIVLLSDGHANEGIVSREVLEHHAEQLRLRGLMTSTAGIGDGYDPTLLQALAQYGGGRMHDAEHPHEIAEVLLGELGELAAAVAENADLTLTFPPNVRVENLNGAPVRFASGRAKTALGALLGARERRLIYRLTLPRGSAGETIPVAVRLSWRAPGGTEKLRATPVTAMLTYAHGNENDSQPRDQAISLEAARAWQSQVVRRVVVLNREHGYAEAQALLQVQLPYFRRYCAGLEGAATLVKELEQMLHVADQAWSERGRKEIELAHYVASTGGRDLRAAPRQAWVSYLRPQDTEADRQP